MLAPLSIEQLQNRFYLEKCPYWFAYEATAKRRMVGRFRDDEEGTEEEKLEYSWMQLEELFNAYPYGKMEIVLKKSESAAVEKSPNHIVEWGIFPERGVRGGTNVIGGAAMGGGAGGNWQMLQFFLEQQNRLTRDLHNAQIETMRLNFENRQLAEALEADQSPGMQEQLLKEGIGVVKTLLTSRQMQPPVHLGTLGQRTEGDAPAKPSNDDTFSIDASMGYVKAITDLFPQYSRIKVLQAFLALAKSNQAFIGAQLQQYIGNEG